jgi:gamma-glutamylcyclotransferase (GGCT)/AIG2-like uncharacterized protein YtfP
MSIVLPDQATILVAAYGTARPGNDLFEDIKQSVLSTTPSRIIGTMYYHASGQYPVADLCSKRNTLVTTTLEMRLDVSTMQFFKMELNCGYTPVWVDELDRAAEPTGRRVLAFDYYSTLQEYGTRIPSGDWNLLWDKSEVAEVPF